MNGSHHFAVLGKIVRFFSGSKITPLLIFASVLLGAMSLSQLPREEEPQIVVPMFDVFVPFPGASPAEVEKRLVNLGERKFWEIPGVEYVYSTSYPHGAMFIVRFKVGEDMEKSLIKLYTKVYSNLDVLPSGAGEPFIKQRTIDDVPILALTFYSPSRTPLELRRAAANLRREISTIQNVSEITIIGGRKRQFQVFLDAEKLRARLLSPGEVLRLIRANNVRLPAGDLESKPLRVQVETDAFIEDKTDLENLVVGSTKGRVVYLKDVARVEDAPDEEKRWVQTFFGKASSQKDAGAMESVTLAIAKRKGANATELSHRILEKMKEWQGTVLPEDIQYVVTRDYGHTAAEKSNELLWHMAFAVFGVSLLIAWALGWRAAGIVLIAIPTTLALTLMTFHLFGFTINRITLFALIFTIGILVDDPIVCVENIFRHLHLAVHRGKKMIEITVAAVEEIVSPLILATLAVIAAILPMAFVGGLMGPYMRPIPIGATAAMFFSLVVSLTITPWATTWILKKWPPKEDQHDEKEGWMTRFYRWYMHPLVYNPRARKFFYIGLGVLLALSVLLIPLRAVRVKMLPFDNKNEFQIVLNMPEGTALETTRQTASQMAEKILNLPEVDNLQLYAGTSAPYNFNGLIRHYYLRNQPHQADIQVNLAPKGKRRRQSHAIAESIRPEINDMAHSVGGHVQIAEVPPGPPVLSTLVLEIYGPGDIQRRQLAQEVETLLRSTDGITDVDTYETSPQPLRYFHVDKTKASLNGLTSGQIAETFRIALNGQSAGLARLANEEEPVEILVRLPEEQRDSASALLDLNLLSNFGRQIPLRDLILTEDRLQNPDIYHKNLVPVSYVLADVTDELGSPVYAMLRLQKGLKNIQTPAGEPLSIRLIHQPDSTDEWAAKWDGEWQITYEVFWDLGAAFAVVLVLIFILVVGWFQSFKTPWAVMLPIPLSLVGIIPAHWMTGVFFTATSMIGLIAGAGIVVRNAIILVDFIELKLSEGAPIEEAVIEAGAVRFRPMLLTATSVVVGGVVILFDPIFQGLALSLIAGEVASTILSRTAVPVLYYSIAKK